MPALPAWFLRVFSGSNTSPRPEPTQELMNLEEQKENNFSPKPEPDPTEAREDNILSVEMQVVRKNRLDAIPRLPMEQIMKYCGFMEIIALRKACTHTRFLVDIIKPDPKIKDLECSWSRDFITMKLGFSDAPPRDVSYENCHGGCFISRDFGDEESFEGKEKFFENTSAVEMFLRDLKILLSSLLQRQKAPLDSCFFDVEDNGFAVFQSTMAQLLSEFSSQIPTRIFALSYAKPSEITAILRLVDGKTLEELHLNDMTHRYNVFDWSLLKPWMHIQSINLSGCLIDYPSRLEQFSTSRVVCKTITPTTVASLRDIFRETPTFQECIIEVDNRDAEARMAIQKEAISIMDNYQHTWYFTTSTPEEVLRVQVHRNIYFDRVKASTLDDVVFINDVPPQKYMKKFRR